MDFFLQLHHFHKRYNAFLTTILAPYKMPNSHWFLLDYVGTHENATTSQIAKYCDVEKSTVSVNIKALSNMGLIHAKPGDDKREKFLDLTERGQEIYTKLSPIILQFNNELLSLLSQEKQKQFMDALINMEKFLKGVEQ